MGVGCEERLAVCAAPLFLDFLRFELALLPSMLLESGALEVPL